MSALSSAYARLNRRWFRNRLPKHVRLVWRRMPDMGTYSCDGTRMTIEINQLLRRWPIAWEATLLHEMAHVATASEEADHGPRWVRERRRLYRAGAFEHLL